LLDARGMALPAYAPADTVAQMMAPGHDTLAAALCAAELNEPFDLVHTPSLAFAELFGNVQQLRTLVPFATFRLLSRLGGDERDEVRAGAAKALQSFVDVYPDRVEDVLLQLACDPVRRVRNAAAETLAKLLRVLPNPTELVDRWRWHPDRATDVLDRARKSLAKHR
jgi:hypothetical protein